MSTFFEQINILPKVRENLQKMGIKTPMPDSCFAERAGRAGPGPNGNR